MRVGGGGSVGAPTLTPAVGARAVPAGQVPGEPPGVSAFQPAFARGPYRGKPQTVDPRPCPRSPLENAAELGGCDSVGRCPGASRVFVVYRTSRDGVWVFGLVITGCSRTCTCTHTRGRAPLRYARAPAGESRR